VPRYNQSAEPKDMPTFNQRGYPQAEPNPKIDRDVVMKLYRAFLQEPSVRGKDGTQTCWCHEHPTLPFSMIRFFERQQVDSFITGCRFRGDGWEMTFNYRRGNTTGEGIDWNVGVWISRIRDEFEHEWTLAKIAA
jgi:hypothetical protein